MLFLFWIAFWRALGQWPGSGLRLIEHLRISLGWWSTEPYWKVSGSGRIGLRIDGRHWCSGPEPLGSFMLWMLGYLLLWGFWRPLLAWILESGFQGYRFESFLEGSCRSFPFWCMAASVRISNRRAQRSISRSIWRLLASNYTNCISWLFWLRPPQ